MPKCIVFGADGFIGRHLTVGLAKQDNEVIAIDRFRDYQSGESHIFDKYSNISITVGDFMNDSFVKNIVQDSDYVFHLVSTTNPAISNENPFLDIDTNIRGSVSLFNICSTLDKPPKIIYFSSGGTVYGDSKPDKNGLYSEDSLLLPKSPYAIGKVTIEHYLNYFHQHKGLEYLVYRASNPYGVGQNIHGNQGVIPIFMSKLVNDEPIVVLGDGSMVRDYIYIEDFIQSILNTFQTNGSQGVYNLGSSRAESINDIIRMITNITHKNFSDIRYLPKPDTYIDSVVLDTTKFKKAFGDKYINSTSLEAGMLKTWEYVNENTKKD